MSEYLDIMNAHKTQCIMSNVTLEKIHAAKTDNVTSYDFELDNTAYFGDYVHLSPAGANVFTELLSKII